MNSSRSSILAALICAFVLSLFLTVAPQASADVGSLVTPVLAQAEAAPAQPPAESSNMTAIVSVAFALLSGIAAIWQNQRASKTQKIAQSIILGVEQATRLPQVQQLERTVKARIAAKSEELGVKDELHALVKKHTG
jgi:hypothetical protein